MSWNKLKSKYTEGYDERMGAPAAEKLKKLGGRRPLWIHAVSVGEVQAAWPLMKAAHAGGFDGPVVISTTTETGKAMALNLASGIFDMHIYYPWDTRRFVKSALDAVNPIVFVTMETELWPNMLWELNARSIPAFLANGRVSDRTWKRCSNFVGCKVSAELYELFSGIFLRDERDRERLKKIGVTGEKLNVSGDMKIDALLSRVDKIDAAKWKEKFNTKQNPVFIAGSTHRGEDEIALEAFRILKKSVPDAHLVIAPRHPERAVEAVSLVDGGLRCCMLSDITSEWDVLVVDMIGVLFELYGACDAALVGGSFADRGGQNILEPAAWGVPVEYGPHMEDFAEVSADFLRLGISMQVSDAEQLANSWMQIAKYKTDGDKEIFSKKCADYFAGKSGASQRTWNGIAKLLNTGGTNGKK